MEPGGHFVHEGTTLLSHQQLRSRLAGEVGVVITMMMVVMVMMIVMMMMMDTKKMVVIGSSGNPDHPHQGKSQNTEHFSNDYKEAEDCDE